MSEPTLKIESASKAYQTGAGSLHVLRGASLHVMPGETVSVRGESGCGKTTLLNIVAGLESMEEGELHWDGRIVSGKPLRSLAKERARFIGMVFQAYCLLPELTALENVLMAARVAGRVDKSAKLRAAELLEKVGMAKRAHGVPAKLSGGECQRVAVARALMNRPRLILADEPTGNLDERSGQLVMEMLLDVCRDEGAALLLATHNVEFADRADRRLRMAEGRLDEIG